MGIDLFGTARISAVIALAGASFASPLVVKSDAVAKIGGAKPAHVQPAPGAQPLVAGGHTFQLPASWSRLGTSSAAASDGGRAAGTIVAAVCPGDAAGDGDCASGVRVALVAYSGRAGSSLPSAKAFDRQLDAELPKRLQGVRSIRSDLRRQADGRRYLRYGFQYGGRGRAAHTEVLGAYAGRDGSGVVAVATGPSAAFAKVAPQVDAFLASAIQSARSA